MAKQGSHSNFSSSSLTSFKFSSSMLPAPCTHKEFYNDIINTIICT